jgi:DNA modification methylase
MIRIIQGHVLDCLARLPDESIHCVVTSPPYYKVRTFGLSPQIWGGSKDCAHDFELKGVSADTYTLAYRPEERATEQSGFCKQCDAWLGSLGAEPNPKQWISNLSRVFKELHRVLRKDGTIWLNLGDRRATSDTGHGYKPKDLMGLPWMTAFHLREQGLYLRSATILAKQAPIPEHGVDRPVTSYDHLFLLTKSAKYYYDGYAVGDKDINHNVKDVWVLEHEYSPSQGHAGTFPKELPRRCILLGTSAKGVCPHCEAPYVRVVNTVKTVNYDSHKRLPKTSTIPSKEWIPSCKCNAGKPIPSKILDPFGGTMTTSLVAELNHRDSISIELSPEWIAAGKKRLSRDGGLFVNFTEEADYAPIQNTP